MPGYGSPIIRNTLLDLNYYFHSFIIQISYLYSVNRNLIQSFFQIFLSFIMDQEDEIDYSPDEEIEGSDINEQNGTVNESNGESQEATNLENAPKTSTKKDDEPEDSLKMILEYDVEEEFNADVEAGGGVNQISKDEEDNETLIEEVGKPLNEELKEVEVQSQKELEDDYKVESYFLEPDLIKVYYLIVILRSMKQFMKVILVKNFFLIEVEVSHM